MSGGRPEEAPRPVLILGIGNVLLGDEGVGVHAVRRLEKEAWPAHVKLLDGGTGGFHLLSLFQEYPRIVLVDATMDGQPPGTVRVIRPRFASDYPRTLSAHDIGLKDLVESAALLGHAPEVVIVAISVKTLPEGLTMDMTPEVAASLPRVADSVREVVET